MPTLICDVEVFSHDWLCVAKPPGNDEPAIIWNDAATLRAVIQHTRDTVLVGFNIKHYDCHILRAACCGADNALVKEISDFLIAGGVGWQHPFIQENRFYLNICDLKDDMAMGLSLKAIEGHLGMPIRESTVSYDLLRPLTDAERAEVARYCLHDVLATERLLELRHDYLKGKIDVGRLKDIPAKKAISMTNAKLTAAFLDAVPELRKDERAYSFPPNLRREMIPPDVQTFFDRTHDTDISDDDFFKSKLGFSVGTCPCVVGFGGIHGALPHHQETAGLGRVIRNYDVASLYPSLMIRFGYTSRNIPSASHFEDVYNRRLAAKRSGDKTTANTLKLVLNTTYGAMLNRYNALFDPRMGRSVCVSGQLFLLELACAYVNACRTLRLLQINTDGIMVSLEDSELPALEAVNVEWQARTGFALEEDRIERLVQKDVNNYLIVKEGGEVKTKGGYLNHGISIAGAWTINNNAVVVRRAIADHFALGVPVEKTIRECQNIHQFQLIAKAGTKYREAYHIVSGERMPVQRVNRVYASIDPSCGKLYKVKAETGVEAQIEALPDRCVIDNENRLTITDIDKAWYIDLANKRVAEFLGIKLEKPKKGTTKMPTTKKTEAPVPSEPQTPMNIYQKLLQARVLFQDADVKKSGKHMHLEFKYFELEDIVPVATRIFAKMGLLPLVSFTNELATMTLVDADDPIGERIAITSPMREIEGIITKSGGKATTPIQNLGSVETYQRRYLYMIALDIVEADTLDPNVGNFSALDKADDARKAKKVEKAADKREQATEALTGVDGEAAELQVRQLKKAIARLLELDPERGKTVGVTLAKKTANFAKVTKTECEDMLIAIGVAIKKAESGGVS